MKDKYSILPDDFKFRMQQEKLKNEIMWQKYVKDKNDKMIGRCIRIVNIDGTVDFSCPKWIEDL